MGEDGLEVKACDKVQRGGTGGAHQFGEMSDGSF